MHVINLLVNRPPPSLSLPNLVSRYHLVKSISLQKNFFSNSAPEHDEDYIPLKTLKKHHASKKFSADSKPKFDPFFNDGWSPSRDDMYFCQKAAMATIAAQQQKGGSGYNKLVHDYVTVLSIIRNYQVYGHLVSKVDPLDMMFQDWNATISETLGAQPQRITRSHQLSKIDMNQVFKLPPWTFIGGGIVAELPLKEIIRRLELVYCRHIGAEYMYIENQTQVNWIRQQMETPGNMSLTPAEKGYLLSRLIRSVEFENFLFKKWQFEKKFGSEGCEVVVPAIKQMIDSLAHAGYDTFVFCMAHRGRLNILRNVIGKPMESIFGQFIGMRQEDEGSGDVKYHLGTQMQKMHTMTKKVITMQLIANPSHLEVASPVAVGATKGQQFYRGDLDGNKVMCIVLHGDASFAGQGLVYEVIQISNLPAYKVHGVIHVVLNNQVGFTTDPKFSRASVYPTDVARVVNAPVFHVNSDDPESVVFVSKLAANWKAKFHKDVVLDIVCYRRRGHNEADEPMFTQPLMYKKIKKLPTVSEIYTRKLVTEGLTDKGTVEKHKAEYINQCEQAFQKAKQTTEMKLADWLFIKWSGFFEGRDQTKCKPTGVNEEVLQHIGKVFSSPPPESLKFDIHPALKKRVLDRRMKLLQKRTVDWPMAEALAFGTLLKEKVHVRVSGQDVERGTFSHRHHVMHHQSLDRVTYNPLQHLYQDQAEYIISNSALSECGVLGFDHGYALVSPTFLIIWEAQFGDFSNVAQTIIDNIIASGESKWARQCGIVIQLPHGYEGMGSEHSSARLERLLQLSLDDPDVLPPDTPEAPMLQLKLTNWFVVNCTTPANLFHVLRRQIALPFRKPLVILTPKSLLKHPKVISSLDEMVPGTEFKTFLPEVGPASKNPDNVKKHILCSGKIYYDMIEEREKRKLVETIAISRIEQLQPFPYGLVKKDIDKYKNAKLFWAQEEPKNQGAWYHILLRVKTLTNHQKDIGYNGRAVSSASATGNRIMHAEEVKKLMDDTMSFDKPKK